MSKTTGYKSFELYHLAKKLVIACYELTHDMPVEERVNFSRYIRTAALNFYVNAVQGMFRTSKKRKKYIRNGKNALVIIDAATEILVELNFATQEQIDVIANLASCCYQLLDEL